MSAVGNYYPKIATLYGASLEDGDYHTKKGGLPARLTLFAE